MSNAQRFFAILTCCLAFANPAAAGGFGFFRASLSDAGNVPPYTSLTNATGRISLRSFRGSLHYSLSASNLGNAFASHIHCAPAGMAGPIGVTLFQTSPEAAITLNGTLAHGPIAGPNPGNDCGWDDLHDVIDPDGQMRVRRCPFALPDAPKVHQQPRRAQSRETSPIVRRWRLARLTR